MPKVYVINKSSHDFSAAEQFGELVYLSDRTINRYATNKMYRQFDKTMRHSEATDYILITSLSVMNVIACVLFALRHKCLNLLIHKTDNNTYVERRMDLSDLS
jgi:hypothetical protein